MPIYIFSRLSCNLASVDTALYLKGPGQTTTTQATIGNFQTTCCASSLGITDLFNDSSGKALYTFNTDGADLSGNYNGTESGVTHGAGYFNNAAIFNGTSSNISLSGIPNTTNLTISIWMNHSYTTGFSGSPIILDFRPINGLTIDFYSNQFRVQRANAGGAQIATDYTTSTLPTTNTWHNVIASISGDTMTVYIDGVSVYTGTTAGRNLYSGYTIGKIGMGCNGTW